MASYPAPSENLQIFNPSVFDTEDVALSLADANKLYAKKSGAIFYGPIAAPSLSLAGVSVGTKLTEIDANTAKLTDVTYSVNTTNILNDFSVSGVLKILPDLPNAGATIIANRNKTTKISYDVANSATIIGDTLKATGTLLVGSNFYNASDQFEKLQNISREASLLTITDSVNIAGTLELPSIGDVDTTLNDILVMLTDVTYDENNDNTKIANNFEVASNFKLNTIADVEQKIIDISNATIPYITYDSVNQKLVVTKNVDLGINDLSCNFMRPLGMGPYGMKYGLSQDWTDSYLLFQQGGNTIDAMKADGTGKELFLNYFSQSDIYLGSWNNNSTTYIKGNLKITENNGTQPSETGGSLTLTHNDDGGTSSIVFRSKTDVNDYGYISYQDDWLNVTTKNRSLLEIGVRNNVGGSAYVDNIALMPSGFVGINTRTPQVMLDVNGDTNITGNLQLGSITDVEDAINNAGGVPSITYDDGTETTTFSGNFVVIPSDMAFQLGLIPNLYTYIIALNSRTSWLENVSKGLKINNNTIIEENLGLRTSQLSIRPVDDLENAVQEIYSKNGTAELKLGDNDGTTTTFTNILKSENGNATFYGNNAGETKYMEYNSTDDKINISKDMDLNGDLLLGNGQGCKILGIDEHHSIFFREGKDGTIDKLDLCEFGDIRFFTGGLLASQQQRMIINSSGNIGVNKESPQATLDVNGDMSCNGINVNGAIIGERAFNSGDGTGLNIKPTTNPSINLPSSGSIFEVRSKVNSARLWVGQGLTSTGSNKFMWGFNNTYGQEGVETHYSGKLDTDGSVDCTEIKVNKIPLNAFYNFTYGYNYTPTSTNFGFGRGYPIMVNALTFNETYSHSITFDRTNVTDFKCGSNFLGTYEINAHVTFRNNNSARNNPCIAIGVNDDVCDGTVGATSTGPNWDVALTDSYSQHNIFSVHYVRQGEGRVTTLSCSRIYHFDNTSDVISINTFIENGGGDSFTEIATNYTIINAGISFKYIGNFENITFVP